MAANQRKGGFENLILRTNTLAGFGMAATMRLTRSGMLEVLSNDYFRTAHAKGLANRTVIIRHALRNALLGLVTFGGSLLPSCWPGRSSWRSCSPGIRAS